MTLEEVLRQVRDSLDQIRVPVSMIESVGSPILAAVQALDSCLEAIRRAGAEEPEKAGTEAPAGADAEGGGDDAES